MTSPKTEALAPVVHELIANRVVLESLYADKQKLDNRDPCNPEASKVLAGRIEAARREEFVVRRVAAKMLGIEPVDLMLAVEDTRAAPLGLLSDLEIAARIEAAAASWAKVNAPAQKELRKSLDELLEEAR